ncbi:MAG: sel1 repeat family protein [Verrucomicrobia bacterium]|nr:sel1 repeat family protein [Verrucomicrobiota bacterium]
MKPTASSFRLTTLTLLCAASLVSLGADTPQAAAARKQFLETKAKAEKGDAPAQYSVGESFRSGQVVAINYVEMVKWYRKAAEQNYAPAQHRLGWAYDSGTGVEQDRAAGFELYLKAAEQNHIPAQNMVGYRLEHGSGVAQNEGEAVQWYRKAAEQDYFDCQCKLARCYENGIGVRPDLVEAYAWYSLAAEKDKGMAKVRDSFVKTFLSPKQLAEGLKRTEELRAQIAARPKSGK